MDEHGNGNKDAGDPVTTYSYDGMGRLKIEAGNGGVVTFTDSGRFGHIRPQIDG